MRNDILNFIYVFLLGFGLGLIVAYFTISHDMLVYKRNFEECLQLLEGVKITQENVLQFLKNK